MEEAENRGYDACILLHLELLQMGHVVLLLKLTIYIGAVLHQVEPS